MERWGVRKYLAPVAVLGIIFLFHLTPQPLPSNSQIPQYSTGTWTPVDNSGASLTFTGVSATYNKVGSAVTIVATLNYPTTVSAAAANIGGLPFTSNTSRATVPMFTTNGTIGCIGIMAASSTNFAITNVVSAANVTNVQLSGAFVSFSFDYIIP